MKKKNDTRQRVNITVVFEKKHNPGTEGHLRYVAYNHLQSKGVKWEGDEVII